MSARIARGSAGKGKARAKSPAKGKSRKSRSPTMLDSLPLPAETIRKVSWWIFLGMLLAVALAMAAAFKLPQLIGTSLGESIGEAGFAVRRVEIKGLDRMQRLPIYAVALDQESMAMPLVDLEGTRQRLLRFGWVQDARVSRRLPDTLVIDIVERQPSAIWQHDQQLALIDREGVVLEQVKLEAMPDLPLVIGPGANRQAGELGRLLENAASVKPLVEGATWVGGRRWDLRFQSGELLSLPEGEAASRKALVHFVRLDQQAQLLGRGFVRFDMRIPGKFIVRVSREPGSIVPVLEPEVPVDGSVPNPATTI